MHQYGHLDTSYKAAGEKAGIQKLVDNFYHYMDIEAEAKTIRKMHPDDLTISKDKLCLFLCAWLGGPKWFKEKYGGISIPMVHQHFAIGEKEKRAWLHCMQLAINDQNYDSAFKKYLITQLAIPAERIQMASQTYRQSNRLNKEQ